MARNGNGGASEEAKVNLTPMIDVTFQLIIFFMLVTELTNMALAQVILPLAPEARPNPGKEGEVVVNIVREKIFSDELAETDGYIKIGLDDYRGSGTELIEKLKTRLRLEAEVYGKWTDHPDIPGKKNSELELLVRSDRGVRAEYFLYLMWACNDVGIYKVHVGAKQSVNPE